MFFFASLKIQTFSFTYPDTLFGTLSKNCGQCIQDSKKRRIVKGKGGWIKFQHSAEWELSYKVSERSHELAETLVG